MQVKYLNSPLGWLEIKANEAGLQAVLFKEFEGESTAEQSYTKEVVNQLNAYFNKKLKAFDLPLSPMGTIFQKSVWKELLKVEYGKTSNYSTIAKQLGDIKKVRAVGMANGKNPISIIIPCHRIIGADGSLVGYAGGLQRKKKLLELEGVLTQTTLF